MFFCSFVDLAVALILALPVGTERATRRTGVDGEIEEAGVGTASGVKGTITTVAAAVATEVEAAGEATMQVDHILMETGMVARVTGLSSAMLNLSESEGAILTAESTWKRRKLDWTRWKRPSDCNH